MLANLPTLQDLGTGEAMYATGAGPEEAIRVGGVWQAITPKPGSKILSSYNVSPMPSTDKV